ncbi:hypothetical protein GMD4S_06297 [Streptococcus sp. GMD4S]|uniref:hypothetical protein n=2 Tax=Streptococcus TaxID=1301 RepID=UPI000280DA92|nr:MULTISPECIES: hypothetical protein [unclassified Streptococcus]EKA05784.1 hypothetical protein GMD6S_07224 [Streptococcus sp. GMD6S]EKA10756.1 hypothetical protein GMD4S_06297 [Streptococcus sp. GMD4S]
MKKRTLVWLVIALVVFGGGAWIAQETNLFLSPRAKQLAYLKEHEEEIKEFVKSLDHKVESVQIDWDETMWEKVGNGTPKGGGNVVIVGGGFNNIEGSTWQVIFEIEDGRVAFDTMMQGGPLRVGGRIFD